MAGAFRTARGRVGLKNRNIFGASRYLPGNLGNTTPYLFDIQASPLPNLTTDIDISSISALVTGNGTTQGMPVVVVVGRAASTSASTSDGTLVVQLVHSDNSTTALSATALMAGSSAANFHGTIFSGLTKAGDKAIRIISATADATTSIRCRATVWKKAQTAALTWTSTVTLQHMPFTIGRLLQSVPGGPAFIYNDPWAGSSGKAPWNSPTAAVGMPGSPWLSMSFTIGSQTFPMNFTIRNGGNTTNDTFPFTGNSLTDWSDIGVQAAMTDWGQV